MKTTKTGAAVGCECSRALAKAVAKRERARAAMERDHVRMDALSPELAAYWRGSITAQLVTKPVRVVVAGGCSCGEPEAVAA